MAIAKCQTKFQHRNTENEANLIDNFLCIVREMAGGFEIGNPALDDTISLELLEEGRNRGLHYHDRGDSE